MDAKEKRNFMKASRVRAGLSQEKLAEILGVARNTIVYYESKPWSISLETFNKLVNLYGATFRDDFFANKLYKKDN